MKRAACLLAAALFAFALALALAAPAFAEPEITSMPDSRGSFDSQPVQENETVPPTTTALPQTESSTVMAVPIDETLEMPAAGLPGAYTYTDIAAFAALGCSLLALLLAVAALSRSGRKPKGNVAGNYQKFF